MQTANAVSQRVEVLRLPHPSVNGMQTTASGLILPDITVYEDIDYGGNAWRTSFAYSYVGDDWNDKISSFVIHAGYFQFYADANFITPVGGLLGPGYYHWVADVGIPNDVISSWHAYYG
ncbi:MAG TPA: peptidase inhibitor family I36 protein [Fimbriimonas sp.]|nr:peptidase inhibitor family I36 protein [Fimbriimonas sp.]